MIVLCNGMPRSASTWSYNVCLRLLGEEFPAESIFAGYSERFLETLSGLTAECRHMVLKSHTLEEAGRRMLRLGAAKAVYTYRDPVDAIASHMRMFQSCFDDALAAIRASFELYTFHKCCGNSCIISYEAVMESPIAAVRSVRDYLDLPTPDDALARIATETGIDAMKRFADNIGSGSLDSVVRVDGMVYDRRSLLHHRHIRDGRTGYGRSLLSPEQQKVVEAAFPESG